MLSRDGLFVLFVAFGASAGIFIKINNIFIKRSESTSSSTEWNSDKCLELIDEYEKHPVLWNPKHGYYYNKIKKNDAWVIIDELMGRSKGEAKKKMDSILSSFRREKAKGKKSVGTGKGRHEVYISKWYAFPRLAFLLDRDDPRPTIDSAVDVHDDDAFDRTSENEDQEDAASLQSNKDNDGATETVQSHETRTPSKVVQKPTESHRKRRKKVTKSEEDKKVADAFEMLKGTVENTSLKGDQCGVYGQHVAHKLRSYTKRTQDIVQHHINTILFNADMGQYDSTPSSSSCAPSLLHSYQSSSVPSPSPHSYGSTSVPSPSPHSYQSTFIPSISVPSPSPHSYQSTSIPSTSVPSPPPHLYQPTFFEMTNDNGVFHIYKN